ncbi:MAG: CvpA family protein [Clostridia bacterium]|nr:CvpA family protein [Clostridia bacterium]
MIGIAVDAFILIICAVIVIRSVRIGFIKSVMGLLKGVVSFIAAYAFTPILGGFIKDKFILPSLSGNIADTIRSVVRDADGVSGVSQIISGANDAVSNVGSILERYGVTAKEVSDAASAAPTKEAAVKTAADTIADPVAGTISNCIAFILIFVVVFLALVILTHVLDSIFHLPVLKTANKVFGLIFGILEALIFAYVLSNVAGFALVALESVDPNVFGQKVIDGSFVMRFFIKIDLLKLISGVLGA